MDDLVRHLCVLGATGSVGQSTLSVVREHPDKYRVDTLVAGDNVEQLVALCLEFKPAVAVIANPQKLPVLKDCLEGQDIALSSGKESIINAVKSSTHDTVIVAISGVHGVEPALAAAFAGKRLLLANKEAVIFLGDLLHYAAKEGGGEVLPIDSEHCALFDLLVDNQHNIKKLWLTASGGAVRDVPISELVTVTPEKTLQHPNWSMGKKVTVDSATMMNKVLETIEASVLFNRTGDSIGIVMHPQSICHALLEYDDGFIHANFSQPNMRLPIARMLAWPDRLPQVQPSLKWSALSQLTFFEPDEARYPCLSLAYQALEMGNGAPAALSAANEVAVARFLQGDIKFTDIACINARALDTMPNHEALDIDAIWYIDGIARKQALTY